MINARVETLADKPAFKRAFSVRRCLLPGRRVLRVVPHVAAHAARGKPLKQPFFIRPADGGILAMAGLYEIWRNQAVADKDARRRVPLDRDRDHHIGRGLARSHPRPDADARRAATGTTTGWTHGPPTPRTCDRSSCPPRPGGWRPTRCRRRSTTWPTTGRCLIEPLAARGRRARRALRRVTAVRDDPDRGRRRPAVRRPGEATRWRPWRWVTAPGEGVDSPDLVALAKALPKQGHHGVPDRAAVGRRRQEGRTAARDPRRRHGRRPQRDPGPHPARSSAVAAPVPGRPAGSPGRWARSGCVALSFPLHPPGPTRVEPAARAPRRSVLPTLVVQGERDAFGAPDGVPGDDRARGDPGCRPRLRRPRAGGSEPEETLALVVEAVLDWVIARIA